jgi:hypothetical protein
MLLTFEAFAVLFVLNVLAVVVLFMGRDWERP